MELYNVLGTISKYVDIAVHWGRLNSSISDNERKMKEILKERDQAKAFRKNKQAKELTNKYNTYEKVQITNKKELCGLEESLNLQHKKFELIINTLSDAELKELCNAIDNRIKQIYDSIKIDGIQRDNIYKNALVLRANNEIDKANEQLEKAKDMDNHINFNADSIEYYKSIVINLRVRLSESTNSNKIMY